MAIVGNRYLTSIIHGTQAFAPRMVASGKPGLSSIRLQAGVKAFTEALQHELRTGANPAVTAHLLIPGFV